jgi:3-deoxy-7-phosphoheptulonate synthase
VVPLTRAAIAVGADAVMIDVHANPTQALCDGPQALYGDELAEVARACRELPPMLGRTVSG